MNTDDRRVRKTKKALQNALAELLLETNLRNITVRELTDKADVHRATFYSHYTDVFDLYEQMENSIIDELSTILTDDVSHTYDGIFEAIIDYLSKNAKLCRMFFMMNENLSFYNRLSTFLEQKYLEIWQYETKKTQISKELRLLTKYHMQGCLAIVIAWVEDDFSYPKEKIADLIMQVDLKFEEIVY